MTDFEKLKGDLESNVQSSESLLQEALEKVTELEQTIERTHTRHEEEIQKIQERYTVKNRDLILENEQNQGKTSGFEKELKQIEDKEKEIVFALEDKKRQNVTLRTTLEKTSASFSEVDADLRVLKMKLKVKKKKKGGEINVFFNQIGLECRICFKRT